ncbi:MAG: hypothetical protein DMG43_09695 [Acidobacteria bacterium]|nr:MAG: hypothetical protein DMG43_09695 [Acidobacteriota bacterium]
MIPFAPLVTPDKVKSMVAFVEPSVRLITEIVASVSFSTRRRELSGVTARWEGLLPTVTLQTEEFVERSNKVTRLGEVAMNAAGSGLVKFAGAHARRRQKREKKNSARRGRAELGGHSRASFEWKTGLRLGRFETHERQHASEALEGQHAGFY